MRQISPMSRVVGKAFAEARSECGRLVSDVKMRNVSDRSRAKMRDAFLALLGVENADRRGRGASMLPYRVRRAVHQM